MQTRNRNRRPGNRCFFCGRRWAMAPTGRWFWLLPDGGGLLIACVEPCEGEEFTHGG